MKILAAFVLFFVFASNAQSIDYNTKKGFVTEGYDVVAYFSNKALKGNSKFQTEHDGAHYKFSSKENLNKFKENPNKYVPKYGGYCAYAIGTDAKKVDIDPETYEIRNGELLLFYNSWGINTLKKWKEEGAENLYKKAEANWTKIKNAE